MLTNNTVIHHLLERGVLSRVEFVDGNVVASDHFKRNRNFRVVGGQRAWFIKEAGTTDPDNTFTLAREAAIYRWLWDNDEVLMDTPQVPRYFDFDQRICVLVIEHLTSAESMRDHHQRLLAVPLGPARLLGEALRALHARRVFESFVAHVDERFRPGSDPWILVPEFQTHLVRLRGAPQLQEIRGMVERSTGISTGLATLRTAMQRSCFTHGDLKFENVLLCDDASRLALIDWEVGDHGDPAWDVGAVLHWYFALTIFAAGERQRHGQMPGDVWSAFDLPRIQAAIATFWDAYRDRGAGQPDPAFLRRAAMSAAARMVQTAYEYATGAPEITPEVRHFLEAAEEIFRAPDDAVSSFFGLTADSAPCEEESSHGN